MEFIIGASILSAALVLCCQIMAKRQPSAQPVVMVEPSPEFKPGRRYFTNTGSAAVVTGVGPRGITGYLVGAGFTNEPRIRHQWDAHGNSPRSSALSLRVEER